MAFPSHPDFGPQLIDRPSPTGDGSPSREVVYFHPDGSVEHSGTFAVEQGGKVVFISSNANAVDSPSFGFSNGQTIQQPVGHDRVTINVMGG